MNYDEGFYLMSGKLLSNGYLTYTDYTFTQGPVMPIVFAGVYKIFEQSEYALIGARLVQLLFLLGGVFGILEIAKKKLDGSWILLFGLALVLNWDFIYFSVIIKTYAVTFFFLTLSIRIFLKENPRLFWAFFWAVLAVLTRYGFVMFPVVLVVYVIIQKQWKTLAQIGVFTVGIFITTLSIWNIKDLFEQTVAYHLAFKPEASFQHRLFQMLQYYLENYSAIFVILPIALVLVVLNKWKWKQPIKHLLLSLAVAITWLIQWTALSAQAEYQVVLFPITLYLLIITIGKTKPKLIFIQISGLTALIIWGSYLNYNTCYGTREINNSVYHQVKEKSNALNALTLSHSCTSVLDLDVLSGIQTTLEIPHSYAMGPFSIGDDEIQSDNFVKPTKLLSDLSTLKYDIVVWSPEMGARSYPSGKSTDLNKWLHIILEDQYYLVDSVRNYGQFYSTHYIYTKQP